MPYDIEFFALITSKSISRVLF